MELLTHGGEHHEIGDGGSLMMTTAMNPPLQSPEQTPDQHHHQPSSITNFMMLTAVRE